MELEYGSIVTDIGTKKLVEAAKFGKKIDIVKFQAGDGGGEYYLPEHSQTALKNVCYEDDIVSYAVSPNDEKQLIIKCLIPSEAGYFVMREWGLVDSDGDLIVVANVSDMQVVPFQTGEILNLNLEVYVQFDNAEFGAVNIVVHPTREEFFRQEIIETVTGMLTLWEADEGDLEELFDFELEPPSGLLDYVEATDEDIRALFGTS